jgi:hypothetical protein
MVNGRKRALLAGVTLCVGLLVAACAPGASPVPTATSAAPLPTPAASGPCVDRSAFMTRFDSAFAHIQAARAAASQGDWETAASEAREASSDIRGMGDLVEPVNPTLAESFDAAADEIDTSTTFWLANGHLDTDWALTQVNNEKMNELTTAVSGVNALSCP